VAKAAAERLFEADREKRLKGRIERKRRWGVLNMLTKLKKSERKKTKDDEICKSSVRRDAPFL
jgi:hypothetical protein